MNVQTLRSEAWVTETSYPFRRIALQMGLPYQHVVTFAWWLMHEGKVSVCDARVMATMDYLADALTDSEHNDFVDLVDVACANFKRIQKEGW